MLNTMHYYLFGKSGETSKQSSGAELLRKIILSQVGHRFHA